jgi:glutamate 5-kinase
MQLSVYSRIVIKIGSALIADEKGEARKAWMATVAQDVARLIAEGTEVVLVSSGSVALGKKLLSIPAGVGLSLPQKQAAAACGQTLVNQAWQQAFSPHDLNVAQILLNSQITENRREFLNARNQLSELLAHKVIPVINENDTIATEELRYGDNDRLSARVAQICDADALLLLSDVDGLFTANPQQDPSATHIPLIEEITPEIQAMASGSTNLHGTGGMATKLDAAQIVTQSACDMILTRGGNDHPLQKLRDGGLHSLFRARPESLTARKQWIAGSVHIAGAVQVDDGAEKALHDGRSLLFAGITAVEGDFHKGDVLQVKNAKGQIIAKGLSNYDAIEVRKLKGVQSSNSAAILGYEGATESIHRDNLVLMV